MHIVCQSEFCVCTVSTEQSPVRVPELTWQVAFIDFGLSQVKLEDATTAAASCKILLNQCLAGWLRMRFHEDLCGAKNWEHVWRTCRKRPLRMFHSLPWATTGIESLKESLLQTFPILHIFDLLHFGGCHSPEIQAALDVASHALTPEFVPKSHVSFWTLGDAWTQFLWWCAQCTHNVSQCFCILFCRMPILDQDDRKISQVFVAFCSQWICMV